MSRTSRKPLVADGGTAALLGIALTLAGSVLLYDAYERRGSKRPWSLRLLPGP